MEATVALQTASLHVLTAVVSMTSNLNQNGIVECVMRADMAAALVAVCNVALEWLWTTCAMVMGVWC